MTQYNRKHKQKGFTLIELVVVIAILGILAAFALPRFAQLSEQAHRSTVKATAGALTAGVALVKAQWVTNGTTGADADVEGFGNGRVGVSANGWPVTVDIPSNDPNMGALRCIEVWQGVMQINAPEVSATADDGVEYFATAPSGNCQFTYQLDGENSKTITYDADTGSVTTNVN